MALTKSAKEVAEMLYRAEHLGAELCVVTTGEYMPYAFFAYCIGNAKIDLYFTTSELSLELGQRNIDHAYARCKNIYEFLHILRVNPVLREAIKGGPLILEVMKELIYMKNLSEEFNDYANYEYTLQKPSHI